MTSSADGGAHDAGITDASTVDGAGEAGPTEGGAGSEAGAPADAAEASAPYNPCPSTGPCIVMPMGDSITWGFGSSDGSGYRGPLFGTTVAADQTITFVGNGQPSGPPMIASMTFPTANEGFSGYTIDDGGGRSGLQPFAAMDVQTFMPQIVLLMIGTNDVDIQLDLTNAPSRLGKLMDTILTAYPATLLVVAQIVPTQDDTENMLVQAYNAAIPGLVQTRAQAGQHVAMVDMYDAFTSTASYKTALFTDNLHPNDAGYVTMASAWYAAVGGLFR